jgi:CHAD domain-containing protein
MAVYRLNSRSAGLDLIARIGEHLRLAEEPAEDRALTLYDTFDWAIYADGGWLEHDCGGDRTLLRWFTLDGAGPPLIQASQEPPGFACDLPQGPVRERILSVSGIRRLLPMVRLRRHAHLLRVLDDEDKTVVRLFLEQDLFEDPATGRSGPLGTLLRVLPVRGYDDELRGCVDLLDALPELGPGPAPGEAYLDALAAIGRSPGDYSSKLDYSLDPRQRADSVTKTILRGLLVTLERNVDGARENLDSEFLHDLRVAVRRTRSALTQIKGVFPQPVVEEFKERFAWLQQVSGPVRDLDVYLLDFPGYQKSLPAPLRPHLEPMREHVLAHYAEAQASLAARLDSDAFRALLRDWRAFLDAPDPGRSEAPNALRPIKAVADARIRRMAKRVIKEGKRITPESPPTDLHELRKTCKKLRYLMEFFQSLYPKAEIRALIRRLKTLLDNLGGFQDLAVQAAHLGEMAEAMRKEGHAGTDTLLAIGALIGNLLERQQRLRDEFEGIFDGFIAHEHRSTFDALFWR